MVAVFYSYEEYHQENVGTCELGMYGKHVV